MAPIPLKIVFFYLILNYCKANLENGCENKKCIYKCCPGNAYMANETCVENKLNHSKSFTDLDVYNKSLAKVDNVKNKFTLLDGSVLKIIKKMSPAPHIPLVHLYLVEDGNLRINIEAGNDQSEWHTLKYDEFCVEYQINKDNAMIPWFFMIELKTRETINGNNYFQIAALIISCIFLLLVLIIYAILKELRNTKGKIVMAYTLSLLGAFISLVTTQIQNIQQYSRNDVECYLGVLVCYFFFLAVFCWMNVMSYDIWWSLRSLRNQLRYRNSYFSLYCIYAWGVPLLMSVLVYVMDKADWSDKPWIIKPNIITSGCFLYDKAKMMYLYVPMLILIASNWAFYILTAYNYWMFGRETKVLDARTSNSKNKQKERFLVYIKLSLIMGLSWVLEVISVIRPDFPLFYVTDAYNLLIGLAIFLIFVCKRKILARLCKRFSMLRQEEYSLDNKTQTSS